MVRNKTLWRRAVLALLTAMVASGLWVANASALTMGVTLSGGDSMEIVGKSGAKLLRVPFTPALSANGTNWSSYYDPIFEAAAKNGVTILPVLEGNMANGATLPGAGEKAAYTAWLENAVRQYGYKGEFWTKHPSVPNLPVSAWEVWNEPNNPLSPGYVESPTTFGSYLSWAGPAIQTTSESWGGQKTGVLFGGLLAWSGGTNYQTYFEQASQAAGSGSYTGVAFHPYELQTSKFPNETRIQAFENAVSGARTYLNGHGFSGKSLWITETGWPSDPSVEFTVGDSEQASLLSQSFQWTKTQATSLNIKAIVWYTLRDESGPVNWQNRCGLRRTDGSYRASWYAYQEIAGAPRWPTPGPSVKVAYSDAGDANSISGWQFGTSTGWQQMFLWGHEVAPGTRPAVLRYNEATHIFFADASRENRITEWSWNSVTGWQQAFLESDPVAANSSPTAVIYNGVPKVFFADAGTGNSVAALTLGTGGWTQTRLYGDAVAANSSPSAIATPGSVQVFFADANLSNTISEWTWGSTLQPGHFYGDPVAAGTSPSAISTSGSSQVFFVDASQGNTIAAWTWGSTLQQSRFYGDSVAAGTSPSAISTPGSSQVFFADANLGNTISEWTWNSILQQGHFYGDPVAANSSPVAVFSEGKSLVYFADEATNRSVAYWEWGSNLQQTRLYGHPVAAGSSPGA